MAKKKNKNDIVKKQAKGGKEYSDKLMLNEIDGEFYKELGKVMSVNKVEWGGKYERQSFKLIKDPILLLEAAERHLLEVKIRLQKGLLNMNDETDNCNHIAKVSTNCMMLFHLLNKKSNEFQRTNR